MIIKQIRDRLVLRNHARHCSSHIPGYSLIIQQLMELGFSRKTILSRVRIVNPHYLIENGVNVSRYIVGAPASTARVHNKHYIFVDVGEFKISSLMYIVAIIAHEFQHLEDINSGKLKLMDGALEWDGKVFKIFAHHDNKYRVQEPWEREAYRIFVNVVKANSLVVTRNELAHADEIDKHLKEVNA